VTSHSDDKYFRAGMETGIFQIAVRHEDLEMFARSQSDHRSACGAKRCAARSPTRRCARRQGLSRQRRCEADGRAGDQRLISGTISAVAMGKCGESALGRSKRVSALTYRAAKLMLLIIQIATAATSPALANTPDTTAALNRITPNAYAILSSAHRITSMKRPNTE
jgi:hypothetical protein